MSTVGSVTSRPTPPIEHPEVPDATNQTPAPLRITSPAANASPSNTTAISSRTGAIGVVVSSFTLQTVRRAETCKASISAQTPRLLLDLRAALPALKAFTKDCVALGKPAVDAVKLVHHLMKIEALLGALEGEGLATVATGGTAAPITGPALALTVAELAYHAYGAGECIGKLIRDIPEAFQSAKEIRGHLDELTPGLRKLLSDLRPVMSECLPGLPKSS